MSKRLVPISVNRILVPVDGSEHSKKAVELAVDMAKKWNAEIYLIHVIDTAFEDTAFDYISGIKSSERASVYHDKIWGQILDPAKTRAKEAGIKKVKSISTSGHPADEIIKTAKRNKVDLIIMGSRGRGRFSIAIMGSVSTKVCNHAHCTCITVK